MENAAITSQSALRQLDEDGTRSHYDRDWLDALYEMLSDTTCDTVALLYNGPIALVRERDPKAQAFIFLHIVNDYIRHLRSDPDIDPAGDEHIRHRVQLDGNIGYVWVTERYFKNNRRR